MTRKKAESYTDNFPPLTAELEREIRKTLPIKYLIIDNGGTAYCTACKEKLYPGEYDSSIKHRQTTVCSRCGETVTAIYNHHNFHGSVVECKSNVGVFLSDGKTDNLYIRFYTVTLFFNAREIMPHIAINEVQRYLFTANQAFRYGPKYAWESKNSYYTKVVTGWGLRAKFSEPVFQNYWDYYTLVNFPALKGTACAHSAISENFGSISYLRFWQSHKNVEALVKCGLYNSVKCNKDMINWAETEPHKMLGVTKDVMRAIRKGQIGYRDYFEAREAFPKIIDLKCLIDTFNFVHYSFGTLDELEKRLVLLPADRYEIMKYLVKQKTPIYDYMDYVRIMQSFEADFSDRQICFPKNLKAAHERAEAMRQAREREEKAKKNAKLAEQLNTLKLKRKILEFSIGDYFIRQPVSTDEIVAEGQKLSHCVGGYAERHATGKLTIMFLRRKSAPNEPYYTIEVSNDYKIVQCRGYKNNWVENGGQEKPQEIINVEKMYQQYLDGIAAKKSKTKSRRKTA